jgi:hypothetical protein
MASKGVPDETGPCRVHENCSSNREVQGMPDPQHNTSTKRLLWEAAWLEIARNLEDYIDRFSEPTWEEREIGELWRELVEMQVEKRELLDCSACKVEDSGFDS